jgi:hypothetical protein
MSLADDGPLLLTNTASLERLNEWISHHAADRGETPPEPLTMRRFRPNVVVSPERQDEVTAATAFVEERWHAVRIGQVDYRVGELCDRCVMTTIDPESLLRGKEPIRTLARRHSWDGKTWFGVRLIPVSTGVIRVGDSIVPA